MKNEQLNSAVIAYKASRNESTFEVIYEAFITKPTQVYEAIAKSMRSSVAEVIATYEDTLLKCIESYDGTTDFERYFNRAVRNERAGVYNKRKRQLDRESVESDLAADDDYSLMEIALNASLTEDNSAATDYLHVTRKKEADQRQLIDFLLQDADSTTTAIVAEFPKHKSVTALGKALGLHHMQVKRKLESLAGKFDPQQFGDYRDYLFA